MASIRKEVLIDANPDEVWDALRDWGAIHERLAPGFLTEVSLDGEDRMVTFFNGVTVRERLIDLDEDARRLVWSIVEGPYAHHNGAAQVVADGDGRTRFIWVADLLPNELADPTGQFMEQGIAAIKKHLEAQPAPA